MVLFVWEFALTKRLLPNKQILYFIHSRLNNDLEFAERIDGKYHVSFCDLMGIWSFDFIFHTLQLEQRIGKLNEIGRGSCSGLILPFIARLKRCFQAIKWIYL